MMVSRFHHLSHLFVLFIYGSCLTLCDGLPKSSCKSPPLYDNPRRPPSSWCSVKATVTVGSDCTTQVEEQILVSRVRQPFSRFFPFQKEQKILDVRARVEKGETVGNLSLVSLGTDSKGNAKADFKTSPSNLSTLLVLQYKVASGVTAFRNCKNDRFSEAKVPDGFYPMVARWAMGGFSVSSVELFEVTFKFGNLSKQYLDSIAKHPDDFRNTVTIVRDSAGDPLSVTHRGTARDFFASEFMYYMRFAVLGGRIACPTVRDCAFESAALKEGRRQRLSREKVIGIAVAVAVLAVAAVGGAVLCVCCRRKEAQSLSEMTGRLPDSLQHFAYDTGDVADSDSWNTHKKAAVPVDEVNATDLLPKGR